MSTKETLTMIHKKYVVGVVLSVVYAALVSWSTAQAGPLSQYGVNALMAASDYPAECNQIVASGVKSVRIAPPWGIIETSRGVHDAQELARLDFIVNSLAGNGIQIDWVLCYTAPWASSNPTSPDSYFFKPADWTDWTNFVSFIANRYKGQVTTWEVWNEEDGGAFWQSSLSDYNTLLQLTASTLRQVSSSNQVVLGGLATSVQGVDSYGLGTFFDSLLALGAASNFDVVNYHSYSDSSRQYAVYNGMMSVLTKYGLQNRPMWITETGYTTNGDSTLEPAKSDYVDQVYTMNSRWSNIAKTFFYTMRNTVTGNAAEDNFGLMTSSMTTLPAFFHLQGLGEAYSNFFMENAFPTVTPQALAVHYLPETTGDGSFITNYNNNVNYKQIAANTYMYLSVNDGWLYESNAGIDLNVYVDVTYLDIGTSTWALQYDSTTSPYSGILNTNTNTGQWLTKTFTIPNAYFGNRQNNGADFRIFAGTGNLVVFQVGVRKEPNTARVVLQNSDVFKLMTHINDPVQADEAYNPPTTIGGVACRAITDSNHYFFFRVSQGLMNPTDRNVTIGVTFWDAGTGNLVLEYNAVGNSYEHRTIAKTNTNTWRYVTVPITDASFQHSMSYSSDFLIGDGLDGSSDYINNVSVVANR